MFAFFAIATPIAAICLAVSAGYFRTTLASRVRMIASIVLSVGGLGCAIASAALFFRSPGAQTEWAENAFAMFFRFGSWITAAVAVTATLSVFFGRRLRDRVVRYAVGTLFCVGMMMITALFATLCNDPETLVHAYVQAFGTGCAAVPLAAFAAEEICSIRADRIDAPEKNKKSK